MYEKNSFGIMFLRLLVLTLTLDDWYVRMFVCAFVNDRWVIDIYIYACMYIEFERKGIVSFR